MSGPETELHLLRLQTKRQHKELLIAQVIIIISNNNNFPFFISKTDDKTNDEAVSYLFFSSRQ